MIYIGLPQWQHAAWHKIGLNDLADYSQYFNCVEGNTTFYALPKQELSRRWRDMTQDNFRFCFKFPSAISHQAALTHCDDHLQDFFSSLSPVHSRIGQFWLQLPAAFSPQFLPRLWQFLDSLPTEFTYGVEVRHPDFFAKGDAERALNRGLYERKINRVMLDSRPVHHAVPHTSAVRDAQQKKPKLPVHAVLTAENPLIRFVGGDVLDDNRRWLDQWGNKLAEWSSTNTPYLFIHTPDCTDAPQQARALWPLLAKYIRNLPSQPDWPLQADMF
jgi:uncharacterized protein YecE (DUF72 family)